MRKLLVTVVCPVLVAALCACVEVASEAVVSAVTATSAIVSGEVTDDASNDDLPRGILYSKKAINPNPFLGGAGVDFKLSDGTGEGVFEVLLTGLEPDTEYVARAFAPEDGKETSKPVYFTTLSGEGLDSYPLTFDGKEVKACAVQGDGKVIIGGSFTNVEGEPRLNLARLLPDGTVDPTFNPEVDQPHYGAFINCVAVQADGKILIGGYFDHIDGEFVGPCIARLNADGTRDSTFSATTGYGSVDCLAIQGDGKILVGGILADLDGATRYQYLGRLNPNGSLDTTFNPGPLNSTTAGPNQPVRTVLVQEDGKILIRGYFSSYNGTTRFQLARLNADGTLDSGFDPGIDAYAIALQPDGKILVSSYITTEHPEGYGIYRLLPDGTLDQDFTPTSGTSVGVFTDSDSEYILVQADGKIVIGGFFSEVDGTSISKVARINADGSLDTTFVPDFGAPYVAGMTLGFDGSLFISTEEGAVAQDVDLLEIFENTPATQALSTPAAGTVEWIRGGGGPEVSLVTFDVSTDGGSSWAPLGTAERISGGWRKTGLTLPGAGLLRARGRTESGYYGGSSGLVEQIEDFPVPGATRLILDHPTVTGVTGTEATLGGEIVNAGSLPILERGVVLVGADSDEEPTVGGTGVRKVAAAGTSAGVFSVVVDNLVQGTTYFYRAYATNASGTQYTEEDYFFTNGPPDVDYDYPEDLMDTSVTLGGEVYDEGGSSVTERGIIVMDASVRDQERLSTKDTANMKFVSGSGLGEFTASVTGLTPGTAYRYVAYAVNGFGTAYSDFDLFTTTGAPPSGPENGAPGGAGGELPLSAAPAGEVDGTFVPTGIDGIVQAIASLPGGGALIAGEFLSVAGTSVGGIARLSPTGQLDPGFFGSTNGVVNSIAIRSDGRIVVGGLFSRARGSETTGIALFEENGEGVKAIDFSAGAGADSIVYSVATQPDGKILVGGLFTSFGGTSHNRIVRLNANGSVDTGFNVGSGADDAVYCILVQPDGKILVAGNFADFNGTTVNRIVRLEANGAIDGSFNPGTGPNDRIAGLALAADGTMLAYGYFTQFDGSAKGRIVRLGANGTPDATFNSGGAGANGNVFTATIQEDGKILLGGVFTEFNEVSFNRIVRLESTGAVDNTFDPGLGADDEVDAIALQEDGNILIGGNFATFDGISKPYLVRFGNEATTESFAIEGRSSATWLRGGSAPLVPGVVFEVSSDSGQSWSELGEGEAIAGGWQIDGLTLPLSGRVRAVGATAGGFLGGSTGLAEGAADFDYTPERDALLASLARAQATAAKIAKQIKAAKKKKDKVKAKKLTKSLKKVNAQIAGIKASLVPYQ
ncbi:MAG: hypothetical protein KDN18_01900 [Verrucomicrobiae bacterium]|nr:hypothetical protein [Verrucomicrobiae bacterium]